MIDVFGVSKSYHRKFKLKNKLKSLELKFIATSDRTLLTDIYILRKQIEEIKDGKEQDLYELERVINRHYKMTLDVRATSTRQIYGYIEDINKEIKRNGR